VSNPCLALFVAALSLASGGPAVAFPPYRSSDAGTMAPYEVGVRVGLGRLQRDFGQTEIAGPLLRSAVGLSDHLEMFGQLEYVPRLRGLGDAALGARWGAPLSDNVGVAVESVALLPVRDGTSGVGAETLLVATVLSGPRRLHLNAGGFHDPRGGRAESGWRASALAEFAGPGYRAGVEVFARDSNRRGADVRSGVGVIYDLGSFDIRSAVHVGLTSTAPDVAASLWITTSFALR
jgi:hypothetical protein